VHQATRQAISKRAPALTNAIKKYNKYCDELQELDAKSGAFPLPEKLPEKMSPLRECPHLLQDVWVGSENEDIPLWVSDSSVREGIRAMLKKNRCEEEKDRLQEESANLLRWFSRELSTLDISISSPSSKPPMF
jgi:hypothetical protein